MEWIKRGKSSPADLTQTSLPAPTGRPPRSPQSLGQPPAFLGEQLIFVFPVAVVRNSCRTQITLNKLLTPSGLYGTISNSYNASSFAISTK